MKKNAFKRNIGLIICFLIITILGLSIGYSALSVSLEVDGNALINVSGDQMIVTDITKTGAINGGVEMSNPSNTTDTVTINATLPNLDSEVIYMVSFHNYSSHLIYELERVTRVTSNNPSFVYTTSGIQRNFQINAESTVYMEIVVSYDSSLTVLPQNTSGGFVLNFDFAVFGSVVAIPSEPYVTDNLILNLSGYTAPVSNKWIDSNGEEITLMNGVLYDPIFKTYIFDGDDDYGQGTTNYIPSTANFTIELYVESQASAFGSTVDQAIVSQVNTTSYRNSAGRFKINFKRDTTIKNTSITAFYNMGSSITNNIYSTVLPSTKYHIQMVRENDNFYYYINGNPASINPVSIPGTKAISTEPFKISKFSDDGIQAFNGKIYAIRIYSDVLTSQELASNYYADVTNYDISIPSTTKNLRDYAIAYEYTTTGTGLYSDTEGRFVYKGSSPNNYLTMDGNDYRIVSYENNGTMKIFKTNNPLEKYAYDETDYRDSITSTYCKNASVKGCNAWYSYGSDFVNAKAGADASQGSVTENASINDYLNTTYYNSLPTFTKNKIVEFPWRVGQVAASATVQQAKNQEKLFTWTGKIAMISAGNILEASSSGNTSIGDNLSNNYLLLYTTASNHMWTLTQVNYNDWDVWLMAEKMIGPRRANRVDYEEVGATYYVYPTFHISSDAQIDTLGTSDSKFVISS